MPPAEVAGIDYPYKNWADIIRKHIPTSKIIIEHQPGSRVELPSIQIGRPHKRSTRKKQAKAETRTTDFQQPLLYRIIHSINQMQIIPILLDSV